MKFRFLRHIDPWDYLEHYYLDKEKDTLGKGVVYPNWIYCLSRNVFTVTH